jgi:hypothetical protein
MNDDGYDLIGTQWRLHVQIPDGTVLRVWARLIDQARVLVQWSDSDKVFSLRLGELRSWIRNETIVPYDPASDDER